jgi:hypothetical protein
MAQAPAPASRSKRSVFAIAALLLVAYAANVALGMAAVKLGAAVWRLGDVGEFLLVLSCMAFFVAGLIADEEESAASGRGEDESNPTEGGVR